MTIRQFIHFLNPELVLSGMISFKVIKHSGNGDKWFFYNEDSNTKTVDEFCEHEGIRGCMDLEIINDGVSIECFPEKAVDNKTDTMYFRIGCVDKKELEK